MMNRGVMQRQMFRNGGAAGFPDLNGDGQVTQKDILMGRGVQGLAMGGPPMDPSMMPPPPPGMMPPPPPGMMAPPPPGIDPAMEQQVMGAEAAGQDAGMQLANDMMANLDGAEDYQTLIDGIRGNSMPLEARYQELAGLVGEQDAMATPESVLALTQPTLMMTEQGAMDSGIGELMQGISGQVDMSGPMEEGVGSLMAAGAGNTPPVNFRNGGPVMVRRFAEGTPPGGNSRVIEQAQAMAPEYQKYFQGAMDSEARAAALEEQNEMARAQMMFDIAGTALNFAGQTQGTSLAERLANSASQTQLTDKIGQRSAGMLTAKQAQLAEDRQMRMAGLQGALSQSQTDDAARQALDLASAKQGEETVKDIPMSIWNTLDQNTKDRILNGKEGTVNGVPLSIYNKLPPSEKRVVLGVQAKEANAIKGVPTAIFNKLSSADQNRLLLGDPQGVNGVPRDIFDKLSDTAKKSVLGTTEGPVKGIPAKVFNALSDDQKAKVILGDPQGVNGVPRDVYDSLSAEDKKSVLGTTEGPVKGIPAKVFNALSDQQKTKVILGDPQGVNGVPRDVYDSLSAEDKKSVLGTTEGPVKGIPAKVFNALSDEQKEKVLLGDPQGVNGIPMSIYEVLSEKDKKLVLGVTEDVKGIPMSVFETLTADEKKRVLLGDPKGVNGVPRDIFNGLSQVAKNKVLGTGDDPIKGLPREVFNKLSKQDQNRFILGDPQGVKGVPRDIYDALPAAAQALIVDPAAQSALEVDVEIAREKRNLGTTVAAENRLLLKTISAEERAVLTLIAKEGRAKIRVIEAEARLKETTLGSEARSLATKKAQEARDELTAIVREGRDLQTQIALEMRNLEATIDKEGRDEKSTIRAEIRALSTAEAKEGRAAFAPFTKTINDKLYRIDLSKPEDKQITMLIDGSTLPDVFGSGTTGKIISIASNEELLSKYANNTLDKEEDGISVTEMEAALSGYTLPTDVSYNTSTKERTSTPGRPLNQSQILALQARKAAGYSVPTGIIFPADDIEATVTKILSEQDSNVGTAPLAEFLTEDAWGSAGFIKNLANIGIEAATFGIAPAYFTDAKNANDAIKNLNQEFETLFMASSEIRDSVFQGKKIEDLTPDPSKPFQGPDASQSKALNIYLRLTRQIERIQQSIIDPNVFQKETGSGSVGEKRQMLPVLMDLAAGYALLAKVDVGLRGLDPQSIEQTQRETRLLDELDAASEINN